MVQFLQSNEVILDKIWSDRMHKLMTTLILAATLVSCGPGVQHHSKVESVASFLLPRPRPSLKLSKFSDELVAATVGDSARAGATAARASFKQFYLKETMKAGGMPSWQGKRVMNELLDASKGACGGASCEKAFGINRGEIDAFFDDAQAEVLQSAALLKAENAETRQTLVASLQKAEDPLAESVERSPLEVNFTKTKDVYAKEALADAADAASPTSASLDITPQDLLNAKSISCSEEICDVVLNKPIDFKVKLPVAMRPEVSLTMKRTAAGDGLQVTKSGTVGIGATPINLGEIIKAKISLKADFSKDTGAAPVIKNVNCKGELSCNLSFVKFALTVDKSGVEFGGTVDTRIGAPLLKALQQEKTVSARVDYADIPAKVRGLRDAVSTATSGMTAIGKTDATWTDISGWIDDGWQGK